MYYAFHPGDFKHYSTTQRRSSFLLPELFQADQFMNYYAQYDRFIVSGISLQTRSVNLSLIQESKSNALVTRGSLFDVTNEGEVESAIIGIEERSGVKFINICSMMSELGKKHRKRLCGSKRWSENAH